MLKRRDAPHAVMARRQESEVILGRPRRCGGNG